MWRASLRPSNQRGIQYVEDQRIKSASNIIIENNDPVESNFNASAVLPVQSKYYAEGRFDQSGRQILHFLHLHAMSTKKGGILGGVCINYDKASRLEQLHWSKETVLQNVNVAHQLLGYLGLENIFRYEQCPSDEDLTSGQAVWYRRSFFLNDMHFTDYITPDWVQSVRAMRQEKLPTPQPKDKSTVRVAVHVRRGDMKPCGIVLGKRYLPNAFFLEVLDKYLPKYCGPSTGNESLAESKNCQVTIYSQSRSVESFQPFLDRGYDVSLDGSIESVWDDLIHADISILSDSAFSYVPAIWNRNVVITPQSADVHAMAPMPGWTVIPRDSRIVKMAQAYNQHLKKKVCSTTSRNQ